VAVLRARLRVALAISRAQSVKFEEQREKQREQGARAERLAEVRGEVHMPSFRQAAQRSEDTTSVGLKT
jgi:hypothetical protein